MSADIDIHKALEELTDRTMLVLDDDAPFRTRMAQALTRRGFTVSAVGTVAEAKDIARLNPPAFAVLDLRLEDGSGLEVVEVLHQSREDARAIMLTGCNGCCRGESGRSRLSLQACRR